MKSPENSFQPTLELPIEQRLPEIRVAVDQLLTDKLLLHCEPDANRATLRSAWQQRLSQKHYLKSILRPSLMDDLLLRDSNYWETQLALYAAESLPEVSATRLKATYYQQIQSLYSFNARLVKDYKRLLQQPSLQDAPESQVRAIATAQPGDPVEMLTAIVDIAGYHAPSNPNLWLQVIANSNQQLSYLATWREIDACLSCHVAQHHGHLAARKLHMPDLEYQNETVKYNQIKQLKKLTRTFYISWEAIIYRLWY